MLHQLYVQFNDVMHRATEYMFIYFTCTLVKEQISFVLCSSLMSSSIRKRINWLNVQVSYDVYIGRVKTNSVYTWSYSMHRVIKQEQVQQTNAS
jgi:hypothetical protein